MALTQRQREAAAVALLALAVFLAVAVVGGAGGVRPGGSCSDGTSLMWPVGSCTRALLVALVGVPAAFLVPLIPAVHALRLFGRLRSDTDRNWLVFLLGMGLLVPVAVGLALHVGRQRSEMAGLWGGFVAFYLDRAMNWGAWLVVAAAFSALRNL